MTINKVLFSNAGPLVFVTVQVVSSHSDQGMKQLTLQELRACVCNKAPEALPVLYFLLIKKSPSAVPGHNVYNDSDYLNTMSRPVQFHPSSGVHAEVFESVCSKECGVGEFKVSILNMMMMMITRDDDDYGEGHVGGGYDSDGDNDGKDDDDCFR